MLSSLKKDKKALRIKITDDADMHMNQCGFQKHMIYIARVAQKWLEYNLKNMQMCCWREADVWNILLDV